MKKLILAIALIIASPAWSMIVSERASLTHWNIDGFSPLNDEEIVGASLLIDHQIQTVSLNVMQPWSCPAGLVCATVMPELRYNFVIESIVYNRCGLRQITAKNDIGLIQVVDSTNSHCAVNTDIDHVVVDLFLGNGQDYSNDRFYAENFQTNFDFGMIEGNGSNARKLEIDQKQVIQVRPVSALR